MSEKQDVIDEEGRVLCVACGSPVSFDSLEWECREDSGGPSSNIILQSIHCEECGAIGYLHFKAIPVLTEMSIKKEGVDE